MSLSEGRIRIDWKMLFKGEGPSVDLRIWL